MPRGFPSYLLAALVVSAVVCAASDELADDLASAHSACQKLRKNKAVIQGCAVKGADGSWAVDSTDGDNPGCAASGTYIDSAHTRSNFGKLRIVTTPNRTSAEQMYGAGFLEGYLTAARIYDHHYNLKTYFVSMLNLSESLEASLDWLEDQEAWAAARIRAAPASDPYWRLLGLIQQQFEGLVAGYQARAREEAEARAARRARRAARRLLAGDVGSSSGSGSGSGGEGGEEGEQGGGGDEVAVGWLERRDLLFLNSNGDVYDIIDALEAGWGMLSAEAEEEAEQADPEAGGSAPPEWRQRAASRPPRRVSPRSVPRRAEVDDDPLRMSLKLGLQGKCSALIKVTGDLGDLLLGHSTHDSYTAMTRIFKHYDFTGIADAAIVAPRMAFSSYPGELFSDDDFYLLSSGLAVLETTNHIYVGDVYRPLTRRCVLSWQRLRLAGWMAGSGEQWISLFSRYNSGTYNNQYMVVNANRFKPREELKPGLLWVVEQLPGMIKSADMTEQLSRGYWPSYNVAYFPDVYTAAGYPDMIARLEAAGAHKHAFSIRLLRYQIAPRAEIMRRDQGGVDSLAALQRVMRYNDWRHDPYAEGNPVGAVCARGDLAPGEEALAKGCFDSKVTSARLLSRLESEVIGGPTAQGQPAFSWSDPRWAGLPHRGMPDTFDFAWERMTPAELPTRPECAAAAAEAAAAAGQLQGQQQGRGQHLLLRAAGGLQGRAAGQQGAEKEGREALRR